MSESGEKSPEDIEKRAEMILNMLGLHWEDLKDKKILDIGANTADLASAARKRGVEVFSVDKVIPDQLEEGRKISPGGETGYSLADAAALPFKDNEFDMVVSCAGPLEHKPGRKILGPLIREALRVTKGELRFTSVLMRLDKQAKIMKDFEVVKRRYPNAELLLAAPAANTSVTEGYLRTFVRIFKDKQL